MINCNKIEIYNPIYFKGKKYKEISKTIRETSNQEILKGTYNKEQLDKIEWLIDDMCRYVENIINIEQLSEEIQLVEDEELRNLIANILKNNKCKHILNDYVNYNINKVKNINDMKQIKIPRKIYDRVYGKYKFYFSINNKCYQYKEYINDSIKIYRISEMLRIIDNSSNNYFFNKSYDEEFFNYENVLYNYNKYMLNKILKNYTYINTYEDSIKRYTKTRENIKEIINYINSDYEDKKIKKINNKKIKKDFLNNLLNKFNNDIFNKIKIETDDYHIYFNLKENNERIISIYIEDTLQDTINFNDDFNEIIKEINNHIFINNLKNIYDIYIQKLNKKYKLVNRQPSISLYEDYYDNKIIICIKINCKNKDGELYSKVINDFELNEDIGYDKLSDKISDSIRNYIYRNNKKEK